MTASTISSDAVETSTTGTRLGAALDQKLADTKQPLFDVVGWYLKAYLATRSLNEKDRSANETAALWLGIEEFKSESEIGTRPCQCTRPDPNVCECWETLKAARTAALARVPETIPEPVPDHDNADDPEPTDEEFANAIDEWERELVTAAREVLRARGAKVAPQRIGLWPAVRFLAPLGNDLAQEILALRLRARPAYDATPVNETVFQDRRYITLLYAAFAARRDYADCDTAEIIRRWQEVGIAAVESAHLVDWFCANHPMQALRIERDLRLKMRKQGWHV
jgi:hypothetical protein